MHALTRSGSDLPTEHRVAADASPLRHFSRAQEHRSPYVMYVDYGL
jgi:hypothetical protein